MTVIAGACDAHLRTASLAEVQMENKLHVAGIGYETNFTGDRVTLVADYSARIVRIGEDLEVPFERVLFMRSKRNELPQATAGDVVRPRAGLVKGVSRAVES